MRFADSMQSRARRLGPGCFAMVMATGIVSIDLDQHRMHAAAIALLAVNLLAWSALLWLTGLRLVRFRRELLADFANPGRGAGFLTLPAATCVLGSQCLTVMHWPALAGALAAFGALCWVVVLYLWLVATIAARRKPGFSRSINGRWLIAVVATQGLAVLATQLAGEGTAAAGAWLFGALCLFLLGGALYLPIITLVAYRIVFLPLRASELTPPYWISMGALAITALAGSQLVLHASASPSALHRIMPFLEASTLLSWVVASWWIPLLVLLWAWRHAWCRVPLRYEADSWTIVFPLGMYTVGTHELARALDLGFLLVVPAIGVYVSLLAWLLAAIGAARHWYQGAPTGGLKASG